MAAGKKPGPVPKRMGERLGHVTRGEKDAVTPVNVRGPVTPPTMKSTWHPTVKKWYGSLRDSGQSKFYEPSDWAFAFYVADVMHHSLGTHINDDGKTVPNMTAAIVRAVMAGMTSLLVTEADRRRVRMEITRDHGSKPSPVAVMDDYRSALAPPSGPTSKG